MLGLGTDHAESRTVYHNSSIEIPLCQAKRARSKDPFRRHNMSPAGRIQGGTAPASPNLLLHADTSLPTVPNRQQSLNIRRFQPAICRRWDPS